MRSMASPWRRRRRAPPARPQPCARRAHVRRARPASGSPSSPGRADVGDDAPQRRGHARIARHQRGLQPHLLDQRPDMQRPAAAEGHGGEALRIVRARARWRRGGSRRPSWRSRRARWLPPPPPRPGPAARRRLEDRRARGLHVRRLSAPPMGFFRALMRPSTMLASVSVGRSLPWRTRPGLALEPALSGPTAAAFPRRHGRWSRRPRDRRDLDHRRAHHHAEIDRGLRRGATPRLPPQARRRRRCRRGRR